MLDFPKCQHCDMGYPPSALVEHERNCQPAPTSVGSVVSREKRLIKSENDVPVFLGEMAEGVCEHEIPNPIQRSLMTYLLNDAIAHKSIYRFAGRQHLAEQVSRVMGLFVHEQAIKYALNALEREGIWFKTLRGPALKRQLRADKHLARAHRRAGCPRLLVLFTTPVLKPCMECQGYVAQGLEEIERVANGGV